MINVEQDDLIPILRSNRNLLITGGAGVGKSYIISNYAKSAQFTAITATTGMAALAVRGETIHRFLGLDLCARPEESGRIIGKWERIKKSKISWDVQRYALLKNLKTIIIDEYSMLRRDQFELIDAVLAAIKDNYRPFGGCNLILVGDFFQLPPVVTNSDLSRYPDLINPYCFQSDLWHQAGFESYNLTTNYRQGEGEFLSALEKIRVGNITKEVEELLESRVNAKLNIPFDPIKLFSHKVDVAAENIECLRKLPGDKALSEAVFYGKDYDCKILEKESPAEKNLYFCKDSQVVMITNDKDKAFVNGTMGLVVDIDPCRIQLSNGIIVTVSNAKWERTQQIINPLTNKSESKVLAEMHQLPFRLAYAVTTHRSQGQTLDYVDIDISDVFCPGMAYVALSRCKTIGGLTLRGWNKNNIKADEKVKHFYGY